MTLTEFLNENVDYLLLDDNGDVYAEVRLPNTYTLDARESIMGALAASTYTRWTESTEYKTEG
jgi:hypothetical protein